MSSHTPHSSRSSRSSRSSTHRFDTLAVRGGQPRKDALDAVTTPIACTATYAFANSTELRDHFEGRIERHEYRRARSRSARSERRRRPSATTSSMRERETLEWLVREHDGEQLRTIAEDAGIPAPAVRQRVSRLRRILRAQWAHALMLLVVAGSAAAVAERAHRGSAIVADPTGDPVARAALAAHGHWRVEHIIAEGASAATLDAKLVDLRIDGRRVLVAGPVGSVTRTIAAATTRPDGTIVVELRDDAGGVQHATARVEGDRMQLTIRDGRLRGTATLVRR